MYVVIADRLILSRHRSVGAAHIACMRVRRSGRAPQGFKVYGIAYVEFRA